jgi:DNA polymerase-1
MTGARPLLLADVPWLLYRSFFALPRSIVGANGKPVNALLGTVNALLAALAACEPRALVACVGAEEATYRVKLYPGYHAHRDPMPDELAEQWRRAPELLEALGWLVADGGALEADDVMHSYARLEAQAGGSALLLTADRDLFASVGEHVAIVEIGRNGSASRIGPEQVRKRYGIGPELVPDFIALRGDPSDGLPGAPGIGPKTAAELLQRYGSLEGALQAAAALRDDRMSPRIASALDDNADLLRTFKEVATLQAVAIERPPDAATDYARGAELARRLGVNALARRLEEAVSSPAPAGGRRSPSARAASRRP